jgi:Arc/MetJ family transcription regulator
MRQSKEKARMIRYLKLCDKCAVLIQAGLVAYGGIPPEQIIPQGTPDDEIQAMDAYLVAKLVVDFGEGRSRLSTRLAARLVAANLSRTGLNSDRETLEQAIRDAYRGARCFSRERRRLDWKEWSNA